MFTLAARGYANWRFNGGALDVAPGWAPVDWLEMSAGVGAGQYLIVKPRVLFIPFNVDGAVKPLAFAHGSIIFDSPISKGVGGGVGVAYDVNRNIGIFIEAPVEYFIGTPKGIDSVVLLLTAGMQVRM